MGSGQSGLESLAGGSTWAEPPKSDVWDKISCLKGRLVCLVPGHLVGLGMLLGRRYHPDEEVEVHRFTMHSDGCHAFDPFLTMDAVVFYEHGPRQARQ